MPPLVYSVSWVFLTLCIFSLAGSLSQRPFKEKGILHLKFQHFFFNDKMGEKNHIKSDRALLKILVLL